MFPLKLPAFFRYLCLGKENRIWFQIVPRINDSLQHGPKNALREQGCQPRKTMEQVKLPSKDLVRQNLAQRQSDQRTQPTLEEIRRQLGWHLCANTPIKSTTIP